MIKNTFLLFILFLAGCASIPTQELDSAREALASAQEAQAQTYAPQKYEQAIAALQSGETLVEEGEYKKAESVLPHAIELAKTARSVALEEQARIAKQLLKEAEKEAQEALKTKTATEQDPPKTEVAPKKRPSTKSTKKTAPITVYTVGEGETLWSIAAKRRVYRDSLLWPLIYKANRDQIKDPRQIYPGQTLSIPRKLSKKELEEARTEARSSKIFPIELFQE